MTVRWLAITSMGLLAIAVSVYGYAELVFPRTVHWEIDIFAEMVPVMVAIVFIWTCLFPVIHRNQGLMLLAVLSFMIAPTTLALYAWSERTQLECYYVNSKITVEPSRYVDTPVVTERELRVCRKGDSDWYLPWDFT